MKTVVNKWCLRYYRRNTTIQFDHIPKEIIYDILSRLPVETLSQCRFVSKDWYNFINDLFFVNLHHSRLSLLLSNNLSSSAGDGLFVVCHTTKEDKQELYLLVEDNKDNENAFPFPTISSSSLLNKMKPLNIKLDDFSSKFTKSRETGLIYTGIEIYTVGSGGIWRRIDKQDIISPCILKRLPTSQVFLHGFLHWELEDLTKPQFKICIVGDEKITSLEIPSVDVGIKFRTLISLRQCLCLADDFKDHMVIWVMKSYGVVTLWIREHVIAKDTLGLLQTSGFINVKTMNKRSVLLNSDEYQGIYDFEKHEFKHIFIESPPNRLDIVEHTGNLISPASITGKGEEYQVQSTPPRRLLDSLLRRRRRNY
ncbi:hypothetical protein AQUCO_01100040v1 [Aquilegia coerulea]|uniref:F-box domain-containing protein n=1 Tax=Aquilegia coerulea TaxID=218851 RepID=A0A2G5E5B0_AQUCA|nr:hypothetical protein AQUCO_01100040v1 [Aquilegia coerulea]